jgi:hypothetical protein
MGKLVLLVALVAALSTPNGVTAPSQGGPAAAAPSEVNVLVRQALEDRIAAGNVPDGSLPRGSNRIAAAAETRRRCRAVDLCEMGRHDLLLAVTSGEHPTGAGRTLWLN